MRWDRLFEDLEAQLEAAGRAELDAEVADRTRREAALQRLVDRLAPALGQVLSVTVLGVGPLRGPLQDLGADWLLLADAAATQAIVPLGALASVRGLDRRVAPAGSRVVRGRLRLGHVLRGVARDRAPVDMVMRDGSRLSGTVDLVGADFVEVAEHPTGEPRRAVGVQAVRLVPLAALALVRSG